MKYLILLVCLLLLGCGASVRDEATQTFDDLTEFASFSLVNVGNAPLEEVRFYNLDTQELYYLGHRLYPIDATPPIPPLFGEMRDVRAGQYIIEMKHLNTAYMESFQREILFGPIVVELNPRHL